MDKPKINIKAKEMEEIIVDTSAKHVKELENELLKLKIENAFLLNYKQCYMTNLFFQIFPSMYILCHKVLAFVLQVTFNQSFFRKVFSH